MNALQKYGEITNTLTDYLNPSKINLPSFLTKEDDKPLPYAYECNNYLAPIISNRITKYALAQLVKRYYGKQIENIYQTSRKVTETSYPRLYKISKFCAQTLSMSKAPSIFVSSALKGINALSVKYGNDEIVLISKKAAVSIPDGELMFIIGHEFGHIAQGNLMCHTVKALLDQLNNRSEILGEIISDSILVPLAQWHRCAEFTADRAGLLCCKDIKDVESLFTKTSMALNQGTMSGCIASFKELDEPHPNPINRLKKLREFQNLRIRDRKQD